MLEARDRISTVLEVSMMIGILESTSTKVSGGFSKNPDAIESTAMAQSADRTAKSKLLLNHRAAAAERHRPAASSARARGAVCAQLAGS